jgi:hypothetical protein
MADEKRTMHYAGDEREVFGSITRGSEGPVVDVPIVGHSVKGEAVGDLGVIDDEPVEWDGTAWVPSSWRD